MSQANQAIRIEPHFPYGTVEHPKPAKPMIIRDKTLHSQSPHGPPRRGLDRVMAQERFVTDMQKYDA